jgi:hypothetical protein
VAKKTNHNYNVRLVLALLTLPALITGFFLYYRTEDTLATRDKFL